MRIGISVCSSYADVDFATGAGYMIERAKAARDANLDSLFVGDHHVTSTPYYQNVPMLGRMLAAWTDKPFGALFLLPLWHPVLLAEQIGTLACLSSGPFIMQCGLGGEHQQHAGMGMDLTKRAAMFEASLTLMRQLWAGETVHESRFWNIQGARISPLPPRPVEVWVGAQVAPAINRTARMAQGWLASPGLTPAEASDSLNRYRQACAEHKREATASAIRRDVFVGATSQEAKSVAQQMLAKGYRGISEQALLVGSVVEVAEQLNKLAEMGYTDVIMRNMSVPQTDAIACIQRLGEVRTQVSHRSVPQS